MNHPSMINDDERNLFQLIKMNDIDGLTRLLLRVRSTGTCLNINVFNESGYTPLIAAANRNDTTTEMITILLEHGADINLHSNDLYEDTALHVACQYHGNLNNAKLLLLHGANPNARTKHLRTPLHSACSNYKIDVMKVLLEFNADCNCQDSDHWTPLHYVMKHGIWKETADLLLHVHLLLRYGAKFNLQGNFGELPLHIFIRTIARTYNFTKISDRQLMSIRMLLESYSNINVELEETDDNRYKMYKVDTALHCAVRFELIEIVKILLEYHPKLFNVETALNIAKNNLESVRHVGENDRKVRLQNIVDCIEVWRRQQIYLYLLNRWGTIL